MKTAAITEILNTNQGEISMNFKPIRYIIFPVLWVLPLSACGAAGGASSNIAPSTIPPVEADGAITAEGQVERVYYA